MNIVGYDSSIGNRAGLRTYAEAKTQAEAMDILKKVHQTLLD